MLRWFRGGGRTVLGLARDRDAAAALRDAAVGLGLADRLRMVESEAALIASKGAEVILLAGEDATLPAAAGRVGAALERGEIVALAEDPLTLVALRDIDADLPGRAVRIRPLSRTAWLARTVLAGAAPPDRVLRLAPDGAFLTVMVAGQAGPLAAQLALAIVRLLHLDGVTPRVVMVGRGMTALCARLRECLPELDRSGSIEPFEAVPTASLRPALILALDSGAAGPLRACDPSGLAPIVTPTVPGWVEVARAAQDPAADRVAEAIHALHLEERRAAGAPLGARPSVVPWDDLPERFREASRQQAAHIPLKLRHAGARTVTAAAEAFAWTEVELARLTRVEHERWGAVVRADGWTYGATRDDRAKRTPLLVPFDALPASEQDMDTLPVRAIPTQVAAAGQTLRRDRILSLGTPAGAVGAGFAAAIRRALERERDRDPARLLVLRLDAVTPAAVVAAAQAGQVEVPVHLALAAEPDGPVDPVFSTAERIAIGAAVALLPAPSRAWLVDAEGHVRETDAAAIRRRSVRE